MQVGNDPMSTWEQRNQRFNDPQMHFQRSELFEFCSKSTTRFCRLNTTMQQKSSCRRFCLHLISHKLVNRPSPDRLMLSSPSLASSPFSTHILLSLSSASWLFLLGEDDADGTELTQTLHRATTVTHARRLAHRVFCTTEETTRARMPTDRSPMTTPNTMSHGSVL